MSLPPRDREGAACTMTTNSDGRPSNIEFSTALIERFLQDSFRLDASRTKPRWDYPGGTATLFRRRADAAPPALDQHAYSRRNARPNRVSERLELTSGAFQTSFQLFSFSACQLVPV